MDERSIRRFTYGLTSVTWVLIAIGLMWVSAKSDEREMGTPQALVATAVPAQRSGLASPDRRLDAAVMPSPLASAHEQPATKQ